MKPKYSQIKKSHTFLAAGLLTASFVVTPSAQAANWAGGTGNWSSTGTPSGWNGTAPNAEGAIANNAAGNANITQNISGGVTVGTISLRTSASTNLTITNTNGITLNQDGSGSGTATILNANTSSSASASNFIRISGGTLTLADNLLISNTAANNITTLSNGGAIRLDSVIAGTGDITINNVLNNETRSGAIRLAGTNTFTGNVNVRSGLTVFTNSSAFGNAANVITLGGGEDGATLLSNAAVTLANNWVVSANDPENSPITLGATGNFSPTFSGTGRLDGDLFLFAGGNASSIFTLSGVISGTGNLTAQNGLITMSQANTFTGITKAGGAILTLANTHALQNSTFDTQNEGDVGANIVLGNTVTTLTLGGLIGTLNLADRFGDGGGDPELSTYPTLTALTLNPGTGVTRTYDGAIANGANNMSLTKTGLGTQVLSGTNTYTGATTVTQGTLVVNGSISTSTTTVQSGATLGGSGTVGALTVDSGAYHTPGNSPGIQNTGNYSNAGTLEIEINGATVGTEYDQVNTTGTVTLSGLLDITMGYTPAENALFFILANDGADAISGTFSNASINGNTYTLGGQDFAISYFGDSTTNSFTGGNDVVLRAVVIPEPGAALLGSLGMLMLLRRRR